MRYNTSKLTTDQLFSLAYQVLNAQDQRHVQHLQRSPEYFRQDLIDFLTARNGGSSPDQIVERLTQQAKNPLPKTSAQSQNANTYDKVSGAVKIIDLGKQGQPQAQNPNTLVAVGCSGGCGTRLSVTIAELEQYREAYCPKCLKKGVADNEAAQKAIVQFLKEVPSFYPHEANIRLLGDECERRKITAPTVDILTEIYATIRSQMPFKRLTEAEGRAMTAEQWDARAKVDSGMGGLDPAKMKEGLNRGEPVIHSSNKTKTFYLPQKGVR